MKNTKMKLFAATVMSLSLLAVASAQTNQTGAIARTGVATQTISVTRSSSQPPQMREVENFKGSVSIQPFALMNEVSINRRYFTLKRNE